MIVKFFYKVGPRAYALSFAFSLAGISLINYCKYHEDWALNNILWKFLFYGQFLLCLLFMLLFCNQKN